MHRPTLSFDRLAFNTQQGHMQFFNGVRIGSRESQLDRNDSRFQMRFACRRMFLSKCY